MNLFDVILARKIEAKHGGGGGNDYKELTITNVGENDVQFDAPIKYQEDGEKWTEMTGSVEAGSSATIFFFGSAIMFNIIKQSSTDTISVEGNAEIDSVSVGAVSVIATGDFSVELTI